MSKTPGMQRKMTCCASKPLSTEEALAENMLARQHRDTYSIIVIGEMHVGKSTLSARMVGEPFNPRGLPTIGVEVLTRAVTVNQSNGDNFKAKMRIWDTAGQERYRALTKGYMRNADGVIFVFDVTNAETFDALMDYWVDEVIGSTECRNFLLIGNKSDLLRDGAECDLGFDPPERLEKLMKTGSWSYKKTSATYDLSEIQHIFDTFFVRVACSAPPPVVNV